MNEFFFKAPTAEEIQATYQGLTFSEFKNLDDDTVAALTATSQQELDSLPDITGMDDFLDWLHKSNTLHNFMDWRQHGLPDRDMTSDEFLERMYHYADHWRSTDPEFGKMHEGDREGLSQGELTLMSEILEEAWDDGNSYQEQYVVDISGYSSSAAKEFGVTYDDLSTKGLLEVVELPASPAGNERRIYTLAGRFTMYLLNARYPAADSVETEATL